MFRNTRDQYGLVARSLHWLTFLLVLGMLLGGSLLQFLPAGGLKSVLIGAHKSTGVLVGLLVGARLLWRLYNPPPRVLGTNSVENYLAHLVHLWLYVLLLLQPLSGVLMSQAYGYPVSVFGVVTLPPLVWHSDALAELFRRCHTVTAILLGLLVVVHTGAALKHHFIDKDRNLMRMLKGA
ncbi:MAG: cytochrome b/b6 domain-containing protein [Desulfosarcinaceae bacterium]|nr:cytochrome b/b6 domain-containing protein [Desulfosarcinaceae bacterium]